VFQDQPNRSKIFRAACIRGGDELTNRFELQPECLQTFTEFHLRIALDFVHDLQKGIELPGGHPVLPTERCPCLAIRKTNDELAWLKSEFPHDIDGECDEFGVCADRGLAHDVCIELVELTQAPALWFLVAKAATNLEPLERFGIIALLVGNDAREGGRQLWTENDVAVPLVGEPKKLPAQLTAGLLEIEGGTLKDGSFVFGKAVAGRHPGPRFEEIAGQQAIPRCEVAEAWKGLIWRVHGIF